MPNLLNELVVPQKIFEVFKLKFKELEICLLNGGLLLCVLESFV